MKNIKMTKIVAGSMASLMLLLSTGAAQADASGQPAPQAAPQAQQAHQQQQGIKLLNKKPKVAPVKKKNSPNRIMTNFNGDTKTEMGFNWFTTDKAEAPQVWISTSKNMKDAKTFTAKAEQVDSQYIERDHSGHFIFADVEKDDNGEPVKDENGKPKIKGYYTDKGAGGPE